MLNWKVYILSTSGFSTREMIDMLSNSIDVYGKDKNNVIQDVEESVSVAQWKFYTILRDLYKYMSVYEAATSPDGKYSRSPKIEEASTPVASNRRTMLAPKQLSSTPVSTKTNGSLSSRKNPPTKRSKKSRTSLSSSISDYHNAVKKYKIVQPYKLRAPPKPTGVIRLFGFGGHVDVKEDKLKKSAFSRRNSYRQPVPRTPIRNIRKEETDFRKQKSTNSKTKSETITAQSFSSKALSLTTLRLRGPPRVASLPSGRTLITTRQDEKPTITDLIKSNVIDDLPIIQQVRQHQVPFITCTSTSPSFNVAVNVQEVLSQIKQCREKQQEPHKDENVCKTVCPARKNDNTRANCDERWALPNWENRCICYPPKDSADYGNILTDYTDWDNKVRPICQKSQIDFRLPNSKIQIHVEALKSDWNNLYRSLISLHNQAMLNQWEIGAGINALEQALNEREVHYKEILQLYKELQKAKMRMAYRCLNRKKTKSSVFMDTLGVSRLLRQIRSHYSSTTSLLGSVE